MNLLVLVGIVLVIIGMLAIVAGSLLGKEGKIEFGFGGFIGPLPFGFATSKEMLYLIIAVAVIFFIVFLLFGLGYLKI